MNKAKPKNGRCSKDVQEECAIVEKKKGKNRRKTVVIAV
jgi:hypothetical protein